MEHQDGIPDKFHPLPTREEIQAQLKRTVVALGRFVTRHHSYESRSEHFHPVLPENDPLSTYFPHHLDHQGTLDFDYVAPPPRNRWDSFGNYYDNPE